MTNRPSPPPSSPEPSPDAGAARIFEQARAPSTAPVERAAPALPSALQAHFPDLEIESLIGQGGMGVVYKARHRRLDRPVALKVLPVHLGEDPAFTERFAREARTMARLDHPNIVRVYDFGETGGLYYLVLEYVDGANLREVMGAGRLAPEEAIAIVPQLCGALQYAHDQGVVHRDIKPENVLLDREGRVKVADFGLAKLAGLDAVEANLTGTGQVMGTPHYMAPEQYRTPQDVDHRADIFSMGVVFYEMLTGELPVGRFRPPSEAQVVDARIDAIVLRTLERERNLRYQRARDVGSDVTRLSQAAPASARAPASPGTRPAVPDAAPRPSGRLAAVLALLALPLGFAAVTLAHGAWGGVNRGTEEVFDRELLKALAGGIVWLLGAVAGVFATVQGARAPEPRWVHKAGVLMLVVNLLLIPVAAIHAMHEARRHAELPRTSEDEHALLAHGMHQDEIVDLWEEVAAKLAEGRLSLEDALSFYSAADRMHIRAMTEEERRQAIRLGHLGLAFLDRSVYAGDPAGHHVTQWLKFGSGRVEVTLAHRESRGRGRIVFPVRHDGERWRLAIGQANVIGGR